MIRKHEKGQILVLFAGGMVALVALIALVLDLGSVYSLQRMERSVADAAALAGAQDLQTPGSRAVGFSDYTKARTDALANLTSRLGGTATCPTNADVVECQIVGTPYKVSIKTPALLALNVDESRAVQVTVRQEDVPLNFARVFGQHDWNVAETSVAGLDFAGQYAVITLRPPVSGRVGNEGDITINGTNSAVVAIRGDIGMNTGAVLNGHSATVSVADGYLIRYFGATTDTSTPPGPAAYRQLRTLVPDPKYPIPVQGSTPNGGPDATATCTAAKTAAVANGYPLGTVCFKPGVYASQLKINNGQVAILEPGVYFLNGGIVLKGSLIGGYDAASPGVALVIPQTQNFTMNGTPPLLALNRGSAYDLRSGGQEAQAAMFNGAPVQTNTTPPIPMSIIVPGTVTCTVTIPAPNCTDQTIDWTGAGNWNPGTIMAIAGVVYAPSDNSKVAGNGDPKGYFGQLVAWTITYSGGSTLNQHYPGDVTNGVVRLDGACSGGSSPCTP